MARYVTEFTGAFPESPPRPYCSPTGAFAVGGISGGVFNPAVGTGPILAALAGEGSAGSLWLYWVGPVAGAALAVPVYRMQHGNGD